MATACAVLDDESSHVGSEPAKGSSRDHAIRYPFEEAIDDFESEMFKLAQVAKDLTGRATLAALRAAAHRCRMVVESYAASVICEVEDDATMAEKAEALFSLIRNLPGVRGSSGGAEFIKEVDWLRSELRRIKTSSSDEAILVEHGKSGKS